MNKINLNFNFNARLKNLSHAAWNQNKLWCYKSSTTHFSGISFLDYRASSCAYTSRGGFSTPRRSRQRLRRWLNQSTALTFFGWTKNKECVNDWNKFDVLEMRLSVCAKSLGGGRLLDKEPGSAKWIPALGVLNTGVLKKSGARGQFCLNTINSCDWKVQQLIVIIQVENFEILRWRKIPCREDGCPMFSMSRGLSIEVAFKVGRNLLALCRTYKWTNRQWKNKVSIVITAISNFNEPNPMMIALFFSNAIAIQAQPANLWPI